MVFSLVLGLILGVASMSANAKTSVKANTSGSELTTPSMAEATIARNLASYAVLADQNAFAYLGRLFAPKVTVDYTALWGGEPQSLTREALMQQWAGFLPGFDVTYHQVSDIKVELDQDNATNAKATMRFSASHFIKDAGNRDKADANGVSVKEHEDKGFWQVAGRYHFTLTQIDGDWLITSVTLTEPSEQGNREVLAIAPERAATNLAKRQAKLVDYQN
ncbi:nuclear transport factor 2 family protein [Shewanella sp. WXL01]|nr:nuclear transport factor 2 family protein [Shewanella sp. WXL01]